MQYPRKITHVIEATATGTLSMVALLANSQAISGKSVTVIYSNRPESPKDIRSIFHPTVIIRNIQMYSFFERFSGIFLLTRVFSEIKPDKIFLHSSFAGFIGRISLLLSTINPRVYYIPHCISFMRKDIGVLKKYIFVFFELIASLKESQYIACSESERKIVERYLPSVKCHLVENAIDFNRSILEPILNLASRKKIVITVGQIRNQKNPFLFGQISSLVKLKDPSIDFVWVGDGDNVARENLINSGVVVTGWVPKEKVFDYLGSSRVYLSTSLWEGMPVSVLEASCSGLPVVVSSCAGNVDVIDHNNTGWIFNDLNEAVELILFSIYNPDVSQLMVNNAHKVAVFRFGIDRYIREIEALN